MGILELWRRSLERSRSERTVITYSKCLELFARNTGLTEDELLNTEPVHLYQHIDSSSLSPASILTHLSALKHFFKFAVRRGYMSREAYTKLEAAIEELRDEIGRRNVRRAPKALTREELSRIMESTKNTVYERVYTLFLYSGIRLSEYKHLKKDNFFLDKSGIYWLRLPAYATKGNKERMAPIMGPTKEETYQVTEKLARWLENYEENLVVNAGSLQVYTYRLSHRLNIPFSLHSFRHTYITNLINSGFPAEVVKEFAGHSHVKTTIDIYYRFSPERARKLVEEFLRV